MVDFSRGIVDFGDIEELPGGTEELWGGAKELWEALTL